MEESSQDIKKPNKTIGAKVSDEVYTKIAEEAKNMDITISVWLKNKIGENYSSDELKVLKEENNRLKETNNQLLLAYERDIKNTNQIDPLLLQNNLNESTPQTSSFLTDVAIIGILLVASVIVIKNWNRGKLQR
jgi:hypothetical protein